MAISASCRTRGHCDFFNTLPLNRWKPPQFYVALGLRPYEVEAQMIDGFRIDVTAEEMGRHLEARIEYHRGRAVECEAKLTKLRTLDTGAEEEDAFEMCGSARVHGLERMAARHRAREVFLIFARNHLVGNEIYRLSDGDLQMLEWLPGEESGVMIGRF